MKQSSANHWISGSNNYKSIHPAAAGIFYAENGLKGGDIKCNHLSKT